MSSAAHKAEPRNMKLIHPIRAHLAPAGLCEVPRWAAERGGYLQMVSDPTMSMPWLQPLQVPQHGARWYIDGVLGEGGLGGDGPPPALPLLLGPVSSSKQDEEKRR
jgi:hypothetical protein